MEERMMIATDAKRVAQKHYDLLQQDDLAKWAETLTMEHRIALTIKGSSSRAWWDLGRGYFEQYGVHYKFNRVDQKKEDYCTLLFTKYGADGSVHGVPVPIHMKKEDDKWKVEQASY